MEADSLKADNKKIWIRGQFVEVTDEVYAAYMKGDRKIRYFEYKTNPSKPRRFFGQAYGR